jgi:hypothetical protein
MTLPVALLYAWPLRVTVQHRKILDQYTTNKK